MNQAIIILDYNNVFCRNYNISREERESIMVSLVDRVVKSYPMVDFIEVRIYGGWYKGQELTRAGSQVMAEHLTMDLFPKVIDERTIIRGVQTVVQSICDVDSIWYNTYREKPGMPRLIINREVKQTMCDENRNHCPIRIVESFARNASRICSVEGCFMDNNRAFIQMGQKMVDAMMVCDMITYSTKDQTRVIFVLTDDVDLFPAIALCRSKQPEKSIELGIVNARNLEAYRDCLKSFNVEVFQLYDVRRT